VNEKNAKKGERKIRRTRGKRKNKNKHENKE
jgi:hypothetical protein